MKEEREKKQHHNYRELYYIWIFRTYAIETCKIASKSPRNYINCTAMQSAAITKTNIILICNMITEEKNKRPICEIGIQTFYFINYLCRFAAIQCAMWAKCSLSFLFVVCIRWFAGMPMACQKCSLNCIQFEM